jgi:hypothetical protein
MSDNQKGNSDSSTGRFAAASGGGGDPVDFQISIKSLSRNEQLVISVKSSDTIDSIKSQVKNEWKIAVKSQRFVFGGQIINDNGTLTSYGIGPGSVVFLVVDARAGSGSPSKSKGKTKGGRSRKTLRSGRKSNSNK